MSIRTNRRTKGKFTVTEKKILKELGIKTLTPRVDIALAFYRNYEKNPPADYIVRWRKLTKDFTEAEWDELARRVNLV